MIDEKKQMAINLLVEGTTSKTEIAKLCGRSRQWLYQQVLDDEECKAELDKRLRQIETFGMNTIKGGLQEKINNIVRLANRAESEKVRLEANTYLVDKVLGKNTTKLEVMEKIDKSNVIDVDEALGKLEEE
ncbi:hypothetical protein [Anaerophilus nitritogenes]|uniref:hypothetical protein n=1 Tax=Anaerophilus nitritogenes TaxID=2498136 RepID=UPI00101D0F40|nr:hypothetical protein [Anaerophilus nitritogenes]